MNRWHSIKFSCGHESTFINLDVVNKWEHRFVNGQTLCYNCRIENNRIQVLEQDIYLVVEQYATQRIHLSCSLKDNEEIRKKGDFAYYLNHDKGTSIVPYHWLVNEALRFKKLLHRRND